jgi:hypothetical protein
MCCHVLLARKLTLLISLFYSSTPNQSNLIDILILLLSVGNEVPRAIIEGNSAVVKGTSIIDVDARTKRISVILSDQIFTGFPVSGTIHLEGLATVEDTTIGTQLGATFSLDLELVDSVSEHLALFKTSLSIFPSLNNAHFLFCLFQSTSDVPTLTATPTNIQALTGFPTYTPTTTASPSSELQLGAKICQCDSETNLCLKKDASYVSYGSNDLQICM